MHMFSQLWRGPSVNDKIILYDGRSTGFNYLRLGLSLAVVLWHSFLFSYSDAARQSYLHILAQLVLPMFFALSGYLISGSLSRTKTIREFFVLRGIRIFPALIVEVVLSACLIGGIFTTLKLGDYLASPQFHAYFWNILGHIHFFLPGVYKTNPETLVNASLWTIPFELECYLLIAFLWITGAIRSRRWLIVACVAIQVLLPVLDIVRSDVPPITSPLPGRLLVLSFLCGVTIYFYREQIVLRAWAAVAAFVIALALLSSPITSYFVALPAAYLTVYLGLTNPKEIPVVMAGDYSYGIYLYAAPIQQAVIYLFPAHRDWWFVFFVALAPICLFAAFSWHVIEQPILQRRKSFIALSARMAGLISRRSSAAK